MTNKNTDPSTIIKWLRDMADLIKDHGFINILKSITLTVLTVIIFYFLFNPSKLFEVYNNYSSRKHKEGVEYRLKIDPLIRSIIKDMRLTLDARRVFVLEAHNGSSNLNGLPFLYLDMRYEDYESEIGAVGDDYRNLDVSRFLFIQTVINDGYWIGTVEELMLIDKRLGQRMQSNGANYVGIILLQGLKSPLGFLGVSYTNEEEGMSKIQDINRSLHINSQKISTLLDDFKHVKK